MAAFAAAEKAKRRPIAELVDLKLPIVGYTKTRDKSVEGASGYHCDFSPLF